MLAFRLAQKIQKAGQNRRVLSPEQASDLLQLAFLQFDDLGFRSSMWNLLESIRFKARIGSIVWPAPVPATEDALRDYVSSVAALRKASNGRTTALRLLMSWRALSRLMEWCMTRIVTGSSDANASSHVEAQSPSNRRGVVKKPRHRARRRNVGATEPGPKDPAQRRRT
jgi:hypothetical protein